MFEKYFPPVSVSNDELREIICSKLEIISKCSPSTFSPDDLQLITLELSDDDFLAVLIDRFDAIRQLEPDFEVLQLHERLRTSAIIIDTILSCQELEQILLRLCHYSFSTQLVGIRYIYAVHLTKYVLKEQPPEHSRLIGDLLINPYDDRMRQLNRFVPSVLAREEIDRVLHNELTGSDFLNWIERFDTAFEEHLKKVIPEITNEMLHRIALEAIMANASQVEEFMNTSEAITTKDKKEQIGKILQWAGTRTNNRLGIRRGGARKRAGFTWTDDRKVEFYKKIQDLPQIDGRMLWDFAYDQLEKADFNYKYIDYLRTQTAFKDVPKKLFDDAVKTWREHHNSFSRLKAHEKPMSFAYRHALALLDYPETKFLTIKRYYGHAKKLCENNDLN